jgi:hypothetical protein
MALMCSDAPDTTRNVEHSMYSGLEMYGKTRDMLFPRVVRVRHPKMAGCGRGCTGHRAAVECSFPIGEVRGKHY